MTTTSRSEPPQCEACDFPGAWLVAMRLPNGERVWLCPPCARQVERLEANAYDRSDPRHPDNRLRQMPKEVRCSYEGSLYARPLTETYLQEDRMLGVRAQPHRIYEPRAEKPIARPQPFFKERERR